MSDWAAGFIVGLCVGVGAMSAVGQKECKLSAKEKKLLLGAAIVAGLLLAVSVIAPIVSK